jgi:hypothetical protein
MPEYLKNKIDKIKDEAEVWVFEKRHEVSYNTIRKRIESILGADRIITWGEKPEDILIKAIKEMKPDIIHFEEPCEQFLSHHLLDIIFSDDREYKIFETMHDFRTSVPVSTSNPPPQPCHKFDESLFQRSFITSPG